MPPLLRNSIEAMVMFANCACILFVVSWRVCVMVMLSIMIGMICVVRCGCVVFVVAVGGVGCACACIVWLVLLVDELHLTAVVGVLCG